VDADEFNGKLSVLVANCRRWFRTGFDSGIGGG
jgi:hypothetical protein